MRTLICGRWRERHPRRPRDFVDRSARCMSTSNTDPLTNAAEVLDALATGGVPDRLQVLAGALALTNLLVRVTPDRELIDAAAGLDALATGRQLDLNEEGRARAARLAARIRSELSADDKEAAGREWIIQRCINAFRNEYQDWPGYCERLMTRDEMMVALKECETRWPEYEFRGHNVPNQRPGNDKPRLVR